MLTRPRKDVLQGLALIVIAKLLTDALLMPITFDAAKERNSHPELIDHPPTWSLINCTLDNRLA
ncbi:MAG: hypothetical protein F9B45_06295 [Phycisphaera sp. RhM]|nr:hypothetical protein [Phycisphaera sp. RhM]